MAPITPRCGSCTRWCGNCERNSSAGVSNDAGQFLFEDAIQQTDRQATESLTHAQQAGEMITHLGAYPSADHRTVVGHPPNRYRHHSAGVARIRGPGARALQGAPARRGGQVGDARGVRAANGSGGGTTCRRRRQDAPPTRRGRRLQAWSCYPRMNPPGDWRG